MARKRRQSARSFVAKRRASIRLRIGNRLAAKGLLDQAIEQYERAVKMDGHNADVRVALADAYFEAEMPEKAYRAYKKALSIQPRHAEGHFCLAEFFLNHGRPRSVTPRGRTIFTGWESCTG